MAANRSNRIGIMSMGAVFGLAGALLPASASARTAQQPVAPVQAEICAVLEKYSGATQIVDDSKLSIVELHQSAGIPCGSWISVESGWSEIRHENGFVLHLREGSYVQVARAHGDQDSVVLYRGEIFGQANGGGGELRILTPNSRIRLMRGSVVAHFDQEEQRTELIAVDGSASLENRFEASRQIQVKAGQFSALDFKILRVIPSVAKPIDMASLRLKLQDLHVPAEEKARAMAFARKSREETFSPALTPVPETASSVHKKETYPAIEAKAGGLNTSTKVMEHLAGAEDSDGEADAGVPRRHKASRSTASVGSKATVDVRHAKDPVEDAERKRLIEDLSKLSSE
ncbi:MAG: hypothetical protein P4M08_15145 [Oligoflexia bacterium]|nr:hypothetical protein [Oligoflexia bacterium]